MSENYPVQYAVSIKSYTGEDTALGVNCVDVSAALDLLKADLGSGEGLTRGGGCIVESVSIKYGSTAIDFTPTDSLNSDDKSGTLTIYFGNEFPHYKRQHIDIFIDSFETLSVNEEGVQYEQINKNKGTPKRRLSKSREFEI